MITSERDLAPVQSAAPKIQTAAFYEVLGVPVSVTNLELASNALHRWAEDEVGRFVCVRDVHGIMLAQSDPQFLAIHHSAAMVVPDGMPLVWIGRRLGYGVDRTCGPDLMEHVLAASQSSGLRHFFWGGRAGVAQHLAQRFDERYPGLCIVGCHTPPFRPLTLDEIKSTAEMIETSKADVVWIGISTPRQEYLMQQLAAFVSCTLVGVGAAFDFHVGAVARAPRWMQRSGLESVFRFLQEPRRLWRRYLVLAPRFVWLVSTQRIRQRARS